MAEGGFKSALLALLEDVHTQWGILLRVVVRKTEVVNSTPSIGFFWEACGLGAGVSCCGMPHMRCRLTSVKE